MPLSPSTRLGHYEIRSLLGKGGMGEVYLAQDSNLKRLVAIKLLATDVTEDHARLRRFQREAYAASSLNHPNILTIYEIGEAEGHRFIASEYVEGESLRQHITHKRMELRDILDTTVQVASALAAADHEGIVHRDIKPENIMLRSDGYVKVLDFGLAKLIDKEPAPDSGETKKEAPTLTMTHTSAGIVLGTIAYMSPEQARGREVDSRSDIWSLGVVVYEMLTGSRPFEGESPNDVIAAILKTEPMPLSDACPSSPRKLNDIISKMLRKDQKERYQSTKELLGDLQDLKQEVELAEKLEPNMRHELHAHLGANNSGAAASGLIHPDGTSINNERPLTHPIPRIDYFLFEVKRHKLEIILALTALAILVAALRYFQNPSMGSQTQTITSLAVLPFENGSGDQNLDYFSEGLSEDLLDRLSQLPELKVIARSSSFKFKSTDQDPQQVARTLGVQALVMGRVAQRGDDLQVRVELVDGRDKTQMWGGQYSGKAADIQKIQAEITNKISDKLRPKLSEDQRRVRSISTDDKDAIELYLRGRFFWNKLTEKDLKQSIEYFNEAIARDPKYAQAYAGLANSYLVLGANYLSGRETYPQAKTNAKKALELDPTLAEGHYAMAATNYYEWNFPEAEKELSRTLEINPNYAMAYILRSNLSLAKGQSSDAILQIRRALDLDPFSLFFNNKLSSAYYYARDYKRALDQMKKTLELEPSASFLYSDMGVVYAQMGMYADALAACQKGIILQKDNPSALASLGMTYALWGKKKEALWVLDTLNHLAETKYVQPYFVASIYAALGDNDKAITWLEKANSERSFMIYLGIDPVFDKLRSEQRYKALIERVHIQQLQG
jgi:eukaryotic-like serine/threonine-protein kinase